MYKTIVHDTPIITVSSKNDTVSYSVNNTKMNPLEALYSSLAGCAAVYAKKACSELGVSAEGIEINCIPKTGSAGLLSLAKFTTNIHFPEDFPLEYKPFVLESISNCAVKEVIKSGSVIDFEVKEINI